MAKRNLESFCFCLAVRHGLLVWGYAKLAISLAVLGMFTYKSVHIFSRVPASYDNAVAFLQCTVTTIPELLDVIFTLILIVAAHKRILKLLEVYYFYSITMAGVYMLVVTLYACDMQRLQILHDMVFHHGWVFELDYSAMLAVGVGNICLQSYLMLLVRSEVLKRREAKEAKLARQKSSTNFRGLRTRMLVNTTKANSFSGLKVGVVLSRTYSNI